MDILSSGGEVERGHKMHARTSRTISCTTVQSSNLKDQPGGPTRSTFSGAGKRRAVRATSKERRTVLWLPKVMDFSAGAMETGLFMTRYKTSDERETDF